MGAIEEIQTVRAAAARVGCEVLALGIGPDGHARGRLRCETGWDAGRLLLALAAIDAGGDWAKGVAKTMRELAPAPWAFVALVQAEVQRRIRFQRERGEIFAGPAFTWAAGVGDCDDHARLVYAVLAAGGVPVRLAFLYRADEWREGPRHVVVQAFFDGAWHYVETTVRAELGEGPYDAARRLGLLKVRNDLATEIRTMSESDLPPVPAGFDSRTTPAQLANDVKALGELGYLGDASGIDEPDDPRFRVAVQSVQRRLGLEPDGLIGPKTRAGIGSLLPWYGVAMGAVATTRARGLDVSSAQGPIDFVKVKDAGFDFVIVKLTDGLSRDASGIANAKAARAAGLLIGAYHYWHPTRNAPEDEANAFADAIDAVGGVDLPPALDWEIEAFMRAPFAKPQDPADVANAVAQSRAIAAPWAVAFVRTLKTRRPGPVLLYFVTSYAAQTVGVDAIVASGLAEETLAWVANYGSETPDDAACPLGFRDGALDLRRAWPTWACWQTSGNNSTSVPGVSSPHVDHDVWNGSIADAQGGTTSDACSGGGGTSIAGVAFAVLALGGLAWFATRG